MRRYTAEKYEQLFNLAVSPLRERGTGTREQGAGSLGHQAVKVYRTKRVAAGDYLDLLIYPVWLWKREASRAKRARPTEEAQQVQNRKDATRRLIWKMNANFTEEDLFLTLTYKGEQPTSIEEAQKDMQAYIRRVKRWREKQGLPELKYITVAENTGDGRKKRVHHHVVMSGMDRDEAERLWDKGRVNASRLQPDEYGLEGLARYITKGRTTLGRKTWSCSRNLKQPRITVADHKVTKRDVERMVTDENEMRRLMMMREPGYILNDMSVKVSNIVSGAYITARLRRITPKGRSPTKSVIKKHDPSP